MRPIVRGLLSSLATVLLSCGLADAAQAQIAFGPCGESNDFACGHLTVSLDPSGGLPGTLTLALRRHRATIGEAHTAIIALAGGPGQPALPFAQEFDELLGPLAATRDLIVFDQRGIGLSDPLSCHAFEHPSSYAAVGPLIEACGAQLGPSRSFYTTADTVADIEAIRQAGGYEKLVLYGTSYGTKVAELYAQTYPGHVEALILDSVVTPTGPEPLERPTFEAIPRILRQMCTRGACAHITHNPIADLAKVLAQMRRAPYRGRVIDGNGRAHEVAISPAELIGVLLGGDFSRALRGEFVTSLAAAARGDRAPIARMLAQAEGAEGESEDFDQPLYYATTCEEQTFPWTRSANAKTRLTQARDAAKALPASAFEPFTATDALQASDIEACARWPYTTAAPPLDSAAFPSVPTLILSGEEDLRTPTSGARELAREIPGSHLLVVPYTGHSVLGEEPTACAREAMIALFSSAAIKPCSAAPPPSNEQPPPRPPLRISLIPAEHATSGLPGRTLRAIRLTIADLSRELLLIAPAAGADTTNLRSGGLRAGWAELNKHGVSFHDYSYVPGLTLSGAIKAETADLLIGGSASAHGTLRLGPHDALVGSLGGRHVTLTANPSATAAIVDGDAQESYHSGSGGSASVAVARELAGLRGGL